jgi:hypothetical protein
MKCFLKKESTPLQLLIRLSQDSTITSQLTQADLSLLKHLSLNNIKLISIPNSLREEPCNKPIKPSIKGVYKTISHLHEMITWLRLKPSQTTRLATTTLSKEQTKLRSMKPQTWIADLTCKNHLDKRVGSDREDSSITLRSKEVIYLAHLMVTLTSLRMISWTELTLFLK